MPRRPLAASPPRSACPLACALDLLGDRWTLLVLRDALLFGKSLFQDFLQSPEGISSNTLTERLKRLERHGLLAREAYQERPVRYRYVPTPKGRDLLPLLREAIVWGARHVPEAMQPSKEQLAGLDALVRKAREDGPSEPSEPSDPSEPSQSARTTARKSANEPARSSARGAARGARRPRAR